MDDEFLLIVRQALLMVVRYIEKRCNVTTDRRCPECKRRGGH